MTNPAAEAWLKQAHEDLKYAQSAAEDGYYGWACFACQQSAEKALKSLLVENNVQFERTHRLLALVEHCEKIHPALSNLRAKLDVLNQYYGATRYADLHGSKAPYEFYTKEMAEEALLFGKEVLRALKNP
jgi:HEPN domain-containing protein